MLHNGTHADEYAYFQGIILPIFLKAHNGLFLPFRYVNGFSWNNTGKIYRLHFHYSMVKIKNFMRFTPLNDITSGIAYGNLTFH